MRRVTQPSEATMHASKIDAMHDPRRRFRTSAAVLLLATAMLGGTAIGATPTVAQSGTISGQVVDAATNAPIQAVVIVYGTIFSAVADAQGRYSLSNLPPGEHELYVSVLGYEAATMVVTVAAGQNVVADFALVMLVSEQQISLSEIVVVQGQAQARAVRAVPQSQQGQIRLRGAVMPSFQTESYAHIAENDFQQVSASPLSTFSIDVDRASYANVRRFINDGERPPIDAVRIEEMINYFPYGWTEVRGEHPFSVTTEVGAAPWKPEHRLVRIGLHARSIDTEGLPPGNFVFLLDVSGSMGSADKLPLIKKAFALLVEQLRPQDRVAIVVYAGAAGLVLPSTPGDERGEILAAFEKLGAGGSTAGGAGIRLAYKTLQENYIEDGNNRVILATDGDFNVGASSDAEMVRLIENQRESGAFLTVLGFGTGNLQDSKMEQIANHGNGNFHYVDNLLEARKVLVEEMGGTLLTLAKDVKLQIEFNPERAAGYRLIGYENRLLDAEDFNDDTKDAGELGAGHTVTALYEVVPFGVEVPRPDVGELRYQPGRQVEDTEQIEATNFEGELMYVKVRYKDPDSATSQLLAQPVTDKPGSLSLDFRFASAVAGFGMLLRDSPHSGDFTLDDVIKLAESSRGDDSRGYRGEFVRLVEATRDLRLLLKAGM